jgi:stalled ribosome rescue protein Dom34
MLEEIGTTSVEDAASGPVNVSPRGSSYPAPRGAVGTEAAHRRREVAFQRLTSELGARLSHIAGDDAWILIGGTREWARLAADALPRGLEERMMFSESLHHDAPDDDIKREAKSAATELRVARGKLLVDRLLERAGGHGRAAAGENEVKRALRASAVDQLLVSPSFVQEHPEQAEDAIRSALAQGADIEMLSAGAAEHLSRAADGIAARLRFALQNPR